MRVFISWSGPLSRSVAEIMRDWLPNVIQRAEPWISTEMERGISWFREIMDRLAETSIGIVCITRENQHASWLQFESGAIVKGLPENRAMTFLVDIQPVDVTGPLQHINHTFPNKESMLSLLNTLNGHLGNESMPPERVQRVLDTWWPEFEQRFNDAVASCRPEVQTPHRDPYEIAEETLTTVRSMARQMQALHTQVADWRRGGPQWQSIIENRTSNWSEMEYELRFIIDRLCGRGVDCIELDRLLSTHHVFPEGMIENTFVEHAEKYRPAQQAATVSPSSGDDDPGEG